MRVQLMKVLDYIAMLEKLDTSQIPPTAQILSHLNVTRADESRPSWPTEALLANAPDDRGRFLPRACRHERSSRATKKAT